MCSDDLWSILSKELEEIDREVFDIIKRGCKRIRGDLSMMVRPVDRKLSEVAPEISLNEKKQLGSYYHYVRDGKATKHQIDFFQGVQEEYDLTEDEVMETARECSDILAEVYHD